MIVDNLLIRTFETRQELGETAAKMMADKVRELLDAQPEVNIIFASAPSQNEFLSTLAAEKDIPWDRINAFHMDEYVGLSEDAPQHFGNFLKIKLFSKVDPGSVFYINGNATDIEQECKRYQKLLESYPTDIVCLGIGENGHIAFNDPHVADFNDPVLAKKVELDLASRNQQVNDDCFETLSEVPTDAITLTIPALIKARFAYCMVPGKTKAEAVRNTLLQNISEEFPSTILRNHSNAVLFIDRDSSGKLEKTASYQ
jgi:glucosamine-6-phosphate deaminase